MPFIVFENSVGRGWVVPDAYGGTQLSYIVRYDEQIVPQDRQAIIESGKVFVEPDRIDRLPDRKVSTQLDGTTHPGTLH
jgi:hypothetical protein